MFATWAGRIPAVRDFSDLSVATFSAILLSRGIGSVVAFPFISVLIALLGARNSALLAGLLMLITLPIISFLPGFIPLLLLLFLNGVFSSFYDISLNSMGSELEKQKETSRMAFLHAWFAVGSVSGALLASLAEKIHLSIQLHFSGMALILSLILVTTWKLTSQLSETKPLPKPEFKLPHGSLLLLGAIGFLASIIEGSVSNWSALYFTDYLHSDESVASLGFATYASLMLIGRLSGDFFKDTVGAQKTLIAGNALAAIGLTVTFFSTQSWLSIVGFGLTGFGVSAIFPFLFSAAAKQGSHALASVATLGYIGGIAAPPLLGGIVDNSNLGFAMLFLALLTASISVLSGKSSLLK